MGYPGQFIGPNNRISDQAVQLQRNTRIGSKRLGSTGIAFAQRIAVCRVEGRSCSERSNPQIQYQATWRR